MSGSMDNHLLDLTRLAAAVARGVAPTPRRFARTTHPPAAMLAALLLRERLRLTYRGLEDLLRLSGPLLRSAAPVRCSGPLLRSAAPVRCSGPLLRSAATSSPAARGAGPLDASVVRAAQREPRPPRRRPGRDSAARPRPPARPKRRRWRSTRPVSSCRTRPGTSLGAP